MRQRTGISVTNWSLVSSEFFPLALAAVLSLVVNEFFNETFNPRFLAVHTPARAVQSPQKIAQLKCVRKELDYLLNRTDTVSYTHLDVYKRQAY